jgi:uncharacterized small protein (DUF1192 family)/predicted RNA-binding Zn-ribbon protein involved in translation (DUF1610 family)
MIMSDRLTPEQLQAMEERANRWKDVDELPVSECEDCCAADLANDIAALLAEVKRLKAELDAAVSDRTPKSAIPHKAETPTKIGNVTFGKGVTIWNCPTCGTFITRSHKYCWNCGQALEYDAQKKGE